jgi:hypothetical protein
MMTFSGESAYAGSMTMPPVSNSSHLEQGSRNPTVCRNEGLISSRVIWHYRGRAARFIWVSSKIDEALNNNSYLNFDFAWSLLAKLAPDLLNLRGYLLGPDSMKGSGNLECALMVLNRSRRGRLPKKKPEYLELADRYKVINSWAKLARHNCEGKDTCNCIKSTRREVRRLIKYVQSLDAVWENF